MSFTKCSQCGLINFLSAENCKRCGMTLLGSPAPHGTNHSSIAVPTPSRNASKREAVASNPYNTEPRASISPLRILVLVLLVVGVGWYQYDKEETRRAAEAEKDQELYQSLNREPVNLDWGNRHNYRLP